jgi:predicted acetyltransferase
VHIELVPATPDQQPILCNLLQFYLHDFSDTVSIEVDHEGKFQYPDLPLYWSAPNRFPFLAVTDGKWAGFVLVRQDSNPSTGEPFSDIAEFFVLRCYRRHGVGTKLAHLAFERFPGSWQVRVMESNSAACQFWQRAIESFTGASQLPSRMLVRNAAWYISRFESRLDR